MSGRPTATIVIPVWNQWEVTGPCLASLRPTLGVRDQVVVVDNGSGDQTPAELRRHPWVQVITNPTNRGFAAACNQGAAAARGEVVVFLNNDTLVAPRWLDGLLAPFAEPAELPVAATGPRSNFVSGPQLVTDAAYTSPAELRRFARAWRQAHRGQRSEVDRLVGFCLAVRRRDLEAAGGFDEGFGIGGFEDDDLCARLREAGGRLLVCHEVFVHHHGHRTFDGNGVDWMEMQQRGAAHYQAKAGKRREEINIPLLSACLIVRDEAEQLPACLDSLAGTVEEIVVYDTGSTDGTPELARQAGARVIEGSWDDDFARARNAALAACRGRWVLSIDADEVAAIDPAALRAQLEADGTPDLLAVPIANLEELGTEAAIVHPAARLFRRARTHWTGRLHERPVARPGQPPLATGDARGVRLTHYGYLREQLEGRAKGARNVHIAEAALAAASPSERPRLLLDLARSLALAGRHEEAVARYRETAGLPTAAAPIVRVALRSGVQSLLKLRRPTDALPWLDRLRQASTRHDVARYFEGCARIALGEPEAALACLEQVGELVEEDGIAFANHLLPLQRGLALLESGRHAEAADLLLEVVREHDAGVETWLALLKALLGAGRDLGEVTAVVALERLLPVLAKLLAYPDVADALVERLWSGAPDDHRLVAFGIRLAPLLPLERALEWSARIRAAGLPERCPLLATAADAEAAPGRRVRAASVAAAAFGDPRGRQAAELAAAGVPEQELEALLAELAALAPDVLDAVVVGAATDPARCLALARGLHALGAGGEARAVLEHGRGLAGDGELAPPRTPQEPGPHRAKP